MKIALLVRTKNRNKYLDYFINYYLSLGIDKIFICDNNNVDNCVRDNIKYKDHPKVHIFDNDDKNNNYSIYQSTQLSKQMLYIKNANYDYILNVDDDEFLIINGYKDIHDLILKYQEYDILYFIWKTYTGSGYVFNNELKYPIDDVINNFTDFIDIAPNENNVNNNNEFLWTKYIVKSSFLVSDKQYTNSYAYTHVLSKLTDKNVKLFLDEYEDIHINHYRTKNFEEYLIDKKINTNKIFNNNQIFKKNNIIDNYKLFNKIDSDQLKRINECLKSYNVNI